MQVAAASAASHSAARGCFLLLLTSLVIALVSTPGAPVAVAAVCWLLLPGLADAARLRAGAQRHLQVSTTVRVHALS